MMIPSSTGEYPAAQSAPPPPPPPGLSHSIMVRVTGGQLLLADTLENVSVYIPPHSLSSSISFSLFLSLPPPPPSFQIKLSIIQLLASEACQPEEVAGHMIVAASDPRYR